ncbi:hypothetical protein QW71_14590 [Paenibacillus sp. IHB B 3415]|uniref:sigma-70 family RNA polymerase sigma factor n=1 Tax=Paenibacillus sp. IHB B 3415 TaxID=867080 RepID=UPI00057409D8|nr:sigma-70 family RNA polymerase sigma factor [Paenibacillus sp. IHB B 3415]KHL94979.1 hypothetical protein QW71_14590 [Paenibacillus sp. IHB B 3415]
MNPIEREDILLFFQEYRQKNPILFKDKVIQSFFESEFHRILLVRQLKGNERSGKQLEAAFRGHYFEFRFAKFMNSIIKFHAIDQMRRNQKYRRRNLLIFDQVVSDEGEQTLGDLLMSKQHTLPSEHSINKSLGFQDSINNEKLAELYSMLTSNQQSITTLRYVMGYQDNEIAKILGISPQAVGSTRNKALNTLRLGLQVQ